VENAQADMPVAANVRCAVCGFTLGGDLQRWDKDLKAGVPRALKALAPAQVERSFRRTCRFWVFLTGAVHVPHGTR
jgi:hypothetical protein